MATIAELVLKLRGDNTDLRQTLADSAQRAVAFTMTIQDAMAMAGKNVARQEGMGALAAKSFLESMQRTLQSELLRIKEQQYGLFITPQDAERLAGEAALAFNNTIIETLSQLRASGDLTSTLERQLISSLDKSGLKAGLALQEAVAVGIQEGQAVASGAAARAARGTFTAYTAEAEKGLARSSNAIVQQGGAWTTLGRRGATALMGLGFGIESFVSGTENGMRRALRSVESFAIFFGPEGLLVAGLITAGLAIYDHFHKIEKQIDDTLKRAVEAASAAANALDQIGLEKALRDIQQGQATSVDPISHELVINKRSQFAKDAFEGSAMDLQAHIDKVDQQVVEATHAGNILLAGKLQKEADDLDRRLDPLRKRYTQIRELLLNPAPQMNPVEARKPIEIKGQSPEARAAEATKEYYESLGILVTRMAESRAAGVAYHGVLIQILDAYSKLGGESALSSGARRPGETLEDTQRRLGMLKELHKAIMDIGPKVSISIEDPQGTIDKLIQAQMTKVLETPTTPGPLGEQMKGFDTLIAQIEIYRNNIELTNMDLQSHGQAIVDIDKALGPLRDQAVGMATDLRKALRAAGLDPAIVDLIVQHWIEGLKRIGAAGADTAGKLQKIVDVMSQVAQTASALSSLNDSLRGDKNTSAVFSAAGNAASSIGSAAAQGGMNVGADIQALSDVINVGNALTASSREIALEHKEILKQNNERLAEVSMRLVGFVVSAGTSVQAQQALMALFANHGALSQFASGATHSGGFLGSGKTGDLQTQIDALTPFLKSVGLTFEQFKKIATDNGFDLFDKEGRLVTDALQQMRDKLGDVIQSLFTFQNTLSDQKSLSDLQQKLSGAPETPQDQVNRNLALIQKLAPNLLPAGASGQGGVNQDALRKMLQDLLQRIAAGKVSGEDFGGFQNLQELISIIDGTASALNELRDVTNGVTAALTNVPTGFKLALTEFDAQDAIQRSLDRNTSPNQAYPLAGGPIIVNVQAGAIAIDPTNKNAAEIGQEALDGLKALSGQKLGNRARWSELV